MKTPFRDSIVRPAGIAGAAMMVAGTLWIIATKSWAFPYMDEWDLVYAIDRLFDSGRFAEFFFYQHNEHRIVFPRIVFMVDYLWFRGSNAFNLTCIVLIQAVHAYVMSRIVSRWSRALQPGIVSPPVLAVTLWWFFYLGQYQNFLWGFQVQFVGVFACATSALYCLMRFVESRQQTDALGTRWLIGAMGLAFVGTFTMANGILIWVVMTALAVVLRLPPRITFSILAGGLVSGGIYFYDFQFPGWPGWATDATLHPATSWLAYPFLVLRYAVAYLGAVAGPIGGMAAATCLGALGLITTIATLWASWRRDSIRLPALTLLGVAGFVLASALVTASGRLGTGLDTAIASRYVAGSSTFWAAMTFPAYASAYALGGRFGIIARKAFFPALLALLAAGQYFQLDRIERTRQWFRLSESALLTGVNDSDAFSFIFPRPESVYARAPILARDRLGVFGRREYGWLGRSLDEIFGAEPAGRCLGEFENIRVLGGGAAVMGWAAFEPTGEPIDKIIIADEKSEVVGLAYGGYPRPDLAASQPLHRQDDYGWHGHTRPFRGEGTAYGVVETAGLCVIPHLRLHVELPKTGVVGFVDTINGSGEPSLQSSQSIVARGWAADAEWGAPVERVEIVVNSRVIGTTSEFHERAGVVVVYTRVDFAHSGWEVEATLPELGPGNYTLAARVVTRTGESAWIKGRAFKVIEESKDPKRGVQRPDRNNITLPGP